MTHDRDGWPDPDPLTVSPSEPPPARRAGCLLVHWVLVAVVVVAVAVVVWHG